MNDLNRGQVIHSAAEVYDEFFLPALFMGWTDRVVAAAQIEEGQSVLDVACGTGVLTLAAAEKVGPGGSVMGLDINKGMLAVARKKAPGIEWRHGRAEALPFPDLSFDAVVSQFGLMFFDDRQIAIQEMVRVLRPKGRLAIAVWDSLEKTPGYAAVTSLLQRLFGDQAADALRAPYMLGDTQILHNMFTGTGLADIRINTLDGTARFPSLESWMYTDVKGWTLASILDDAQFDLLSREARRELQPFVGEDGTVTFSAPAHIISAYKA
jgi:ubiquinone/menaquinone biosynthesis C-methylase UbiE